MLTFHRLGLGDTDGGLRRRLRINGAGGDVPEKRLGFARCVVNDVFKRPDREVVGPNNRSANRKIKNLSFDFPV